MEKSNYDIERIKPVPDTVVNKVAPTGLGFGDGSISFKARKLDIDTEVYSKIEKLVDSSEILTAVSTDKTGNQIDDDGCGDGRVVARIFEGQNEKNKSLQRPKVFGGGATMATAARIGLGYAEGISLRQVFSDGMSDLRDKMIGFGAHTDTHAEGTNSGCGAIDKAPLIIANTVKFKSEIRATIDALGISNEGLDEVEEAFGMFAKSQLGEYSGKDVMAEIIDNGKIVKELDDEHKEVIVILNLVEGYTVDQEKIRAISDGKAQAFAVDVWRVKQIVDRLYNNESNDIKHKAYLSELTYTLATAGTLTSGDLPVYVIAEESQPQYA